MYARTLVFLFAMSLSGLVGVSCLDVTPVKVDRLATSKARATQCFACIHAAPGLGCGTIVRDCNAIPSCQATLACTDAADCYGGTRDDLTICVQDCLKYKGSFISDTDPGVVPAGALYICITQGACREPCLGVDEGGVGDAANTVAQNDGGTGEVDGEVLEAGGDGASSGACQNPPDSTIVAGGLDDAAAQCGIQCLGQGPCSQGCMADKTGLSQGCAKCYGDAIQCGYEQCLAPCLKTDKTDCTACTDLHCAPTARACTGL